MNEMTLAEKLWTYQKAGRSWDEMATEARSFVTEELYQSAAQLLDPNTVVTDDDEYHRGMVELIMEFTGMGSDDKEAIAEEISKRTGVHRLTLKDFGKSAGGDYIYLGPLAQAIRYVKAQCTVEVVTLRNGNTRVNLDDGNCWGNGDTEEVAWRYAIAAELGPTYGAEDEFSPILLLS